ncbi:MAG: hypothetical protein JSS81_29585 [Acidobacteria bacterium]|nr:hypothetical protein [Acidobacteriota bacterium]
MKIKTAILTFLGFLILLTAVVSAFGQEKEVRLEDRRITIRMEKQPLGLIFRYLMEKYDIPIGFEESALDKYHSEYFFDTNMPAAYDGDIRHPVDELEKKARPQTVFKANLHPITVNVENGKLTEVFDQIVPQMLYYKWEINDNVVNIFPVQGRFDNFEKLMEMKIFEFTFEKGKTVNDITVNIKRLPEISRFLKENELLFRGYRPGGPWRVLGQYGRTIDAEMKFSDLTFRELLNKITKVKKGGWMVSSGPVKPSGRIIIDIDI